MWQGVSFVRASWKALTNSIPASSLLLQGGLYVRMQVAPEQDAGLAPKVVYGRNRRNQETISRLARKAETGYALSEHSRWAKALLLGDAGINMPALLLGDAGINMPAVNPLATSRP